MQSHSSYLTEEEQLVLIGHEGMHSAIHQSGGGGGIQGTTQAMRPSRQLFLQSSFGQGATVQSSKMTSYLTLACQHNFMKPAEVAGRPFPAEFVTQIVTKLQGCAGFPDRRNPILSDTKSATQTTLEFLAAALVMLCRIKHSRRAPLSFIVGLPATVDRKIKPRDVQEAMNVLSSSSENSSSGNVTTTDVWGRISGTLSAGGTPVPEGAAATARIGGQVQKRGQLTPQEVQMLSIVEHQLRQTCPLWVDSLPAIGSTSGAGDPTMAMTMEFDEERVLEDEASFLFRSRFYDELLEFSLEALATAVPAATSQELHSVRLVLAFKSVLQKQMGGCSYSVGAENAVIGASLRLLELACSTYEVKPQRVFNALCELKNIPGLGGQKAATVSTTKKEEVAKFESREFKQDDTALSAESQRGKRNRSPINRSQQAGSKVGLVPVLPPLPLPLRRTDPVLVNPVPVNSILAVQSRPLTKEGRVPIGDWQTSLRLSQSNLSVAHLDDILELPSVVQAARRKFISTLQQDDKPRNLRDVVFQSSRFAVALRYLQDHKARQQTENGEGEFPGQLLPSDDEVARHIKRCCPPPLRGRHASRRWDPAETDNILDLSDIPAGLPAAEAGANSQADPDQCFLQIGTLADDEENDLLKMYLRAEA